MDESACNEEGHVLYTEPSFAIYGDEGKFEGGFGGEDLTGGDDAGKDGKLERSATIGENVDAEFSFERNLMGVIGEEDDRDEGERMHDHEDGNTGVSNRFKDLKIGAGGESTGGGRIVGGGSGYEPMVADPNEDFDREYYEAMVRENPSNARILRNYAQYLEAKGDFLAAEDYYFRASVADPGDGEILCHYAKLVWEFHGDRARASDYFERAIGASPQNSDVLAAYASFLWKIDESEEEEEDQSSRNTENRIVMDLEKEKTFNEEKRPPSRPLHLAMGLGIDSARFGGDGNVPDGAVEENHRRNVDENPYNPLFLRNYADFLYQSKGDLGGAEEYYSRALLADPSDGQACSAYANVVWQLHRDKDRAATCFERAVQAAPQDSDVLAAYAKFLWETETEDNNSNAGIREKETASTQA